MPSYLLKPLLALFLFLPFLDCQGGPRLMIVAPDKLLPALKHFHTYKQGRIQTDLVKLEAVLRYEQGADDPERLKRFLYRSWKQAGLDYVLLVGDVDVLPVRYMVLDRITPAAFDYSFYPSDLYYADLAKRDRSFESWNAQTNGFHAGYYGEVRGEKNKADPVNFDEIDYLPEIAVGRWPVSTLDETRELVAKTIAYESNLLNRAAGSVPQAGMIAVGGWVDTRGQMDRWSEALQRGGWNATKLFYGDEGKHSQGAVPSSESARALFNSGVDLVVHTGHGQPDAWEQCFSVRDLDAITNQNKAVIISAGCSTAYFAPLAPYDAYVDVNGVEHTGTDHKEVFNEPPPPANPYQKGRFNPTGLGEQFLKHHPSGGVAYIGCNTGSQPCALTLTEGFLEAVANSSRPVLGDCWKSAVAAYYTREKLAELKPNPGWYPPSIFFQAMKFMVFGDPSLPLGRRGQDPPGSTVNPSSR